jgi:hypothetical protein
VGLQTIVQEEGDSSVEPVEPHQLADIATVRPRQRVEAVDARRAFRRFDHLRHPQPWIVPHGGKLACQPLYVREGEPQALAQGSEALARCPGAEMQWRSLLTEASIPQKAPSNFPEARQLDPSCKVGH